MGGGFKTGPLHKRSTFFRITLNVKMKENSVKVL